MENFYKFLFVVAALIISFLGSLFLATHKNFLTKSAMDIDMASKQKFHKIEVPRIGGIAIFIAIILVFLLNRLTENYDLKILEGITFSGLFCFVIGTLEDITKKIGVKIRLASALLSASIVIGIHKYSITHVGISFLDILLFIPAVSFIFTIFCVAGVANAFNIIDGYNGLSSMTAIICLVGMIFIAISSNQSYIIFQVFILIAAILGFFLINYPFGKLFLGDGGAYFIGFCLAELSIFLSENSQEISSFAFLLLFIYPVTETVFSIYRRVFLKKKNPSEPDSNHLHQLIYMRITKGFSFKLRSNSKFIDAKNYSTSPYLWALNFIPVVLACMFYENRNALIISIVIFIYIYILIYKKIVTFKTRDFYKIF